MKFARYMKDTQVPEWKKAYIDYRGLKKHISAIKKAQESGLIPIEEHSETPRTVSLEDARPSSTIENHISHARTSSKYGSTGETPPLNARNEAECGADTDLPPPVELPSPALPLPHERNKPSVDFLPRAASNSTSLRPKVFRSKTEAIISETRRSLSNWSASSSGADLPGPSFNQANNSPKHFFSGLRRRQSTATRTYREGSSGRIPLPLSIVIPTLTPLERQFMDKLDQELDKVETFYRARESEAMIRATALKEQLRELQDHRRIFHEARAAESLRWRAKILPHAIVDRFTGIPVPEAVRGGKVGVASNHLRPVISHTSAKGHMNGERSSKSGKERERSASPASLRSGVRGRLDPEEYQSAKKELKKAILESYRFLELLNNYRVLNLTGFRKALKKFEKTVRVNVQQSYMQEKVETSAFSSGESIEKMIKDIEELYASRFEKGDMKKARMRLRTTENHKTHHFSTFRAGVYLGLAIPAVVDGLYKSFQKEVREDLPWDALLLVYAVFMIPVLFCLLVGINIWVWRKARINYQFIFDLDIRTQLDSREYFELPALLLCTLSYSFWLTFSRIGTTTVRPTGWPIVWLITTLIIMLDPFNVLFPKSRWWLIRKIVRLLMSGTKPVEFTDFWLGDQFCSLIFTLSNLYFVGCVYNQNWNNVWVTCSSAKHWGVPFALASLPLVVRTVQSIKRYVDSRLYTHLINAGKYASNLLYYLFFYLWRHNNSKHDASLVLFILFGVNYSLYTLSWDLLMDWSLFKHPAQHPFLRKSLVYSSNYYVYYVAIFTNAILRFTWIMYIPSGGFGYNIRSFIAAMLEMFRRWQWNFLRLENEHIGNTDQYRVTREVPLPYNFDDVEHDSDEGGDEDDEEHYSTKSSWRRRQPVRMSHLSSDEDPHEQVQGP